METRSRNASPPTHRRKEAQWLSPSGSAFWLFFDARGKIGHCSESLADLLRRSAADLKGAIVTSILPGLPIDGKTPGHNVALMTMDYVNRCHALKLTLAENWWLPVDAAISSVHLGTEPVFVVELRSPGVQAQAGARA